MPEDIWSSQRFLLSMSDTGCGSCWRPAVDVYRDGDSWLLKFELAGVAPSDVQLRISGDRLTLAGVRRDISVREGRQAYSMEISYSRFERTVVLPVNLEQLEIARESRDGMFLVLARPRQPSR